MPFKDPEKKKAYGRKKMQAWRAAHPEDNKLRCKKSYQKHKEQRLLDTRLWKQKNPELARASQLISAARKRAPCTLSVYRVASIIKNGVCQVTGLRLIITSGKPSPWSPSLDRIDGKQGYTHENTRVVVWLYNTAKNEFSDEDVIILAQAIVNRSVEKIVPSVADALNKK